MTLSVLGRCHTRAVIGVFWRVRWEPLDSVSMGFAILLPMLLLKPNSVIWVFRPPMRTSWGVDPCRCAMHIVSPNDYGWRCRSSALPFAVLIIVLAGRAYSRCSHHLFVDWHGYLSILLAQAFGISLLRGLRDFELQCRFAHRFCTHAGAFGFCLCGLLIGM